jgi:hypothetical protein
MAERDCPWWWELGMERRNWKGINGERRINGGEGMEAEGGGGSGREGIVGEGDFFAGPRLKSFCVTEKWGWAG